MPAAVGLQGNPYDVIVVGAGATGGWAALRLGAAGMKVLLLEAGPNRRDLSPLRARIESFLEKRHRFGAWRRRRQQRLSELAPRQPIQSLCSAWVDDPEAFVDDVDNPYVAVGAPFYWFRARQVGGRLAVRSHGRRFLRFTDHELKAAELDGHGLAWPVSQDELAPHYADVERRIGWVPRECNLTERWLKGLLARCGPRRAMLPIAKVKSPDFIAPALQTGHVTLRSGAIVSHLELDPSSNEVRSVAVIDATTNRCGEIFGRRVFLCASTIESTRVLLNSRCARYPDGLGNVSGVLGRHFMEHVHVFGRLRVPAAHHRAWLLPQGVDLFMPFQREPGTAPKHARGFGVQVMAGRLLGRRDLQVCLSSFGEMLPRHENRVTLSATTKDKWGLPVAEIEYRLSDNEKSLIAAQRCFLESLGGGDIGVEVEDSENKPLGHAIHEVGTARMGADPRTSFLDPYNRSWEIGNLYVTDGSSFVTSGYQNPTLTMLALTDRACARVLEGREELPRGLRASRAVTWPAPAGAAAQPPVGGGETIAPTPAVQTDAARSGGALSSS